MTFDPGDVSYREILQIFFTIHDPTTLNRQGADVGTQYRSAIFYRDDEQKRVADDSKCRIAGSSRFSRPIVTEIVPAGRFWKAEEYHQKYLMKRGAESCSH